MNNELVSGQSTNIDLAKVDLMNILICSNKENKEQAENLKAALSSWANAKIWEEISLMGQYQ